MVGIIFIYLHNFTLQYIKSVHYNMSMNTFCTFCCLVSTLNITLRRCPSMNRLYTGLFSGIHFRVYKFSMYIHNILFKGLDGFIKVCILHGICNNDG